MFKCLRRQDTTIDISKNPIELGPPPIPKDDWSYEPRMSVTLDTLDIEIIEPDCQEAE